MNKTWVMGLVQEEHTRMAKLIVEILKYSLFIGKYQIPHLPAEHCTHSNCTDSNCTDPNPRPRGSPHNQQTKELYLAELGTLKAPAGAIGSILPYWYHSLLFVKYFVFHSW